jgi:acetyl coenzyme A synthetase (ADP forming)-like protein
MVVGQSSTLAEIFEPRSVAVIGASNRPGSVGASVFRNILTGGFQGVVYPVNPSWKSVSGVRCFPDVRSLPEAPDLGIIIVPAPGVAAVVDALGRRGTKGAIVISAGFREVGGEGIAREEELVTIARRHRMSIVGPNCFGVINTDPSMGLNGTFSDAMPPRGPIAFVSQSGALCAGILKYGIAERLGFSRFISVGNRAGVDENDLLRALGDDDATKVILLYIESLADGRVFLETAREVTDRKPVLVIKSGRSSFGERAARSHTGSLAQSGRDRLFDALFEQSGVIRADTIGDLFRMAKIFASGLTLDGPRLAIVTNSGGPGIVAADAAARAHLQLPDLPPATHRSLAAKLSPSASIANPLDFTADATPAQYGETLRTLLGQERYNGALVIMTPTGESSAHDVALAVVSERAHAKKPIVACMFGLTDLSAEVAFLEEHGIPTFTFPEEAIAGLSSLSRYHEWSVRPRTPIRHFDVDLAGARRIIREAQEEGLRLLPITSARRVLECYGIRFPPSGFARDEEEVVSIARGIGYPVALKVVSPQISHKTDVGGVAVALGDEASLRDALRRMRSTVAARAPGATIEGFDVEGMVTDGKEVLVGVQRDPAFGPILAFGMGGIYVEVLQDVTFRLAPIRPLSAVHMVDSVRSVALLKGVRGEPPGDLVALYEALERVSQLAVELPEISELDVNPLMVRREGSGVLAVDARIAIDPSSRSEPPPSAGRSGTARPRTTRRGAASPRRR